MKKWIFSHKKTVLAGACVLTTAMIISGIFIYNRNNISDLPMEDESALSNRTSEINVWGEVKYLHMENISIDFPTLVTEVLVKEGDLVTLSQPLLTLDLTEYKGNIEKLKDQLTSNQAALPAVKQDISALEADIDQTQLEISRKTLEYKSDTNTDLKMLQDSLSLAVKELNNAENDIQNYQQLYEAGAVSKETLNQYSDALKQRQKAVNDVENNIYKTKLALKDELDRLNVSLKSKQVQLSQLQIGNNANLTKQQSGVSLAQIDLNLMMEKTARNYIDGSQIVSNLKNGIVQNITVSNGDHLGIQGTPTQVLQIIDADSITVSAEVDEEFISSIKVGDPVRIIPTSVPDADLSGTVIQIPHLAIEKDGKRVVRVLVKPQDTEGLLKPGYTVDVYFPRE